MSDNFNYDLELLNLTNKLSNELVINKIDAQAIVNHAGMEMAKKLGQEALDDMSPEMRLGHLTEMVSLVTEEIKSDLEEGKTLELAEVFARLGSINAWQNLLNSFDEETSIEEASK